MAERRFEVPTTSETQRLAEEAGVEEPQALERNTRRRSRTAALTLKMGGASYAEIAQMLDFDSAAQARQACEQAIIESGSYDGDKENLRALMGLQLDQWHRSIATKIIDPTNNAQLEYMAMGLRLLERKSRLFGVDAPTKIELHDASNEEIAALIEKYEEKLGLARPVEGDPFVEDEDGVWIEAKDEMGEIDDDDR